MESRAFSSSTPLVATPLVQSAVARSPSASTHKANPFADVSSAALAEFQSRTQQQQQHSQISSMSWAHQPVGQPVASASHASSISNDLHGVNFVQPFQESPFLPRNVWGATTAPPPAPAPAPAPAPPGSASTPAQDDRFPANFDVPLLDFSAPVRDSGAILAPQPSRGGDTALQPFRCEPTPSSLPQPSSVPARPSCASTVAALAAAVRSATKCSSGSESKHAQQASPLAQCASAPAAPHSPSQGRAAEHWKEQPYNFEQFKEQMRVVPSLHDLKQKIRTFVTRNMHRVAPVDELVAEMGQFMAQMSLKFASNDAWKNKHPSELDNAIEGLEQFVCINLYPVLFQPQLSEDSDKDKLLFDRAVLFRFIEGKHLDLPADCCQPDVIAAAARSLAELDKHKTPREKLACVSEACDLLRTMLKHPTIDREQFFLSALILATLRAQPKHLYSNLKFITRFRNPLKIRPQEQYYLLHVEGVVEYLDGVEPKWLSIEPSEFDASVNRSVDSLGDSDRDITPSASVTSFSTLTTCAPAPAPAPALAAALAPSCSPAAAHHARASPLGVCSPLGDSQLTPTANAPPPWHTATTTTTMTTTSTTTTSAKGSPRTRRAAAAEEGRTARTHVAASTAQLAASLGSGWCDIGAELGGGEAQCGGHGRDRMLSSLVPTATTASACSGSSGIASDLADLDPLGLGPASSTADPDSLSLHSLAWGSPSPVDAPVRSRTASMRSALSHHSTDVAQCHATDLMAFAPAAAAVAAAGSSRHATRPAPPPLPLDPYRDGDINQLLAAATEPPVDKFMNCDVEGLGMSDIPLLLADYKRLAALNASLSRVLRLNAQ